MATHQLSTNVVPITSSRRYGLRQPVTPELRKSPELAFMLAFASALRPKQRRKVKVALRGLADRNPADASAQGAYILAVRCL